MKCEQGQLIGVGSPTPIFCVEASVVTYCTLSLGSTVFGLEEGAFPCLRMKERF